MRTLSIISGAAAAVAVAFFAVSSVSGVTYGGGSVEGYQGETALDIGTIVQLTGKESNRVKAAVQAEQQNMFGVTVDKNQLSLTLSKGYENEVFVAVSGTYNVLVSTQNGTIAAGDYVTISSLNGVAMKSTTKDKTVFGRAAQPFTGKDVTLGTATLKDTTGKATKTVTIGSIPVTIDIKRNPNIQSTRANLPDALQRVGQAIAEKEVSPLRMYLSIGITAVSILAAIAVLYAGVRSSVISIGRNPMSKKTIFRGLLEVILSSLLILIIGLFAVYLLLKL